MDYRRVAPCKGCEDRCVTEDFNCHSECEEYVSWRSFMAEQKFQTQVERAKDARVKYAINGSRSRSGFVDRRAAIRTQKKDKFDRRKDRQTYGGNSFQNGVRKVHTELQGEVRAVERLTEES